MIKFLVDKKDIYYKVLAESIIDELEENYPDEKCGYISVLKDIFKADTIVICGWGDFPKKVLLAINILKKPLILYYMPQESPFFNRLSRKARGIILKTETEGYEYFPSPVLVSDLATPRHIERLLNREKLVSRRGSVGIIGLNLDEEQCRKLADSLNLLIEDLDLNVIFIPILEGESEKDITVKYSANVRYIQTNRYSSKEILGILSRIDILITSDEKGVIFAMAVDRPVIGLTADDELDSLLGGITQEDILLDIDKISHEELYSKIKIAWVHKDSIVKQIQGKTSELKKKADEGIRRLGKWISQ